MDPKFLIEAMAAYEAVYAQEVEEDIVQIDEYAGSTASSITAADLIKQRQTPKPQLKGLSVGKGGFNVGGKPVNPGMSPIFQRPGAKPASAPAAKPAAAKPSAKPAAAPAASGGTKPAALPSAAKVEAPKPAAEPKIKKDVADLKSMQAASQERQKPSTPQISARAQALKAGGPQGGARDKMLNQSFDMFDVVKGHLIGEGYADTEEAALAIMANMSEEWKVSIIEASYSAKAARAGKDIGKPGKQFAKIAKEAGERYGSKERGEKVAGAVLAKIRAKHG